MGTWQELDARSEDLWQPAVRRGYRVDIRAALAASRANPSDSMLIQLRKALKPGARVYPRLNVSGTVTGRMTMHEPNLMGLSPAYREALLAEPGHVLVGCDLDHVEPTIAAALCGDPTMVAAVQPGCDLYLDLASRIAGEDVLKGDPRRAVAKVTLLAILYGKGAASLAVDLGVNDAEARRIRAGVFEAYPRLGRWVEQVRATPKPVTWAGRELPSVGDEKYKSVNYTVQGSAAIYFKAAASRVDRLLTAAGMPGALWLPIHDELVVQVPADCAEEAAALLQEGMCGEVLGVPVTGAATVLGERFRKG